MYIFTGTESTNIKKSVISQTRNPSAIFRLNPIFWNCMKLSSLSETGRSFRGLLSLRFRYVFTITHHGKYFQRWACFKPLKNVLILRDWIFLHQLFAKLRHRSLLIEIWERNNFLFRNIGYKKYKEFSYLEKFFCIN